MTINREQPAQLKPRPFKATDAAYLFSPARASREKAATSSPCGHIHRHLGDAHVLEAVVDPHNNGMFAGSAG